jgi:hypothetical protein
MNSASYVVAFGRDPAVGFVVPPRHFGSGCSLQSLCFEKTQKIFLAIPHAKTFNERSFFNEL